jgi:hypothetical protein
LLLHLKHNTLNHRALRRYYRPMLTYCPNARMRNNDQQANIPRALMCLCAMRATLAGLQISTIINIDDYFVRFACPQ